MFLDRTILLRCCLVLSTSKFKLLGIFLQWLIWSQEGLTLSEVLWHMVQWLPVILPDMVAVHCSRVNWQNHCFSPMHVVLFFHTAGCSSSSILSMQSLLLISMCYESTVLRKKGLRAACFFCVCHLMFCYNLEP